MRNEHNSPGPPNDGFGGQYPLLVNVQQVGIIIGKSKRTVAPMEPGQGFEQTFQLSALLEHLQSSQRGNHALADSPSMRALWTT
jgi:hypothetical protein